MASIFRSKNYMPNFSLLSLSNPIMNGSTLGLGFHREFYEIIKKKKIYRGIKHRKICKLSVVNNRFNFVFDMFRSSSNTDVD